MNTEHQQTLILDILSQELKATIKKHTGEDPTVQQQITHDSMVLTFCIDQGTETRITLTRPLIG